MLDQLSLHEFWHSACGAVSSMESRGIPFSLERCAQARLLADVDLTDVVKRWDALSGGVNPRSHPQLTKFLYETKKYPLPPITGSLKAVKRRKPKELPTGEASLDWLKRKARNPENVLILSTLLELRKIEQLHRFLVSLPEFVGPDGRLYTSFSADKSDDDDSGGTRTGRLASSKPNVENIPSPDRDKYGIRSCFVSAPGTQLLVVDYSALELYVIAHWMIVLFGDHSLLNALQSGDVYGAVACSTWPDKLKGVLPKDIKHHADPELKKLRAEAKIIVLSSNYLKSIEGLALQLGCSVEEATDKHVAYNAAFPGIKQTQGWAADYARRHGGVHTFMGRFRPLPDIHSERNSFRGKAERQAINTCIQGSAAEIVFGAMIQHEALRFRNINQIHDETVAEVPLDNPRTELYVKCLENPLPYPLRVPLVAVAKLVTTWDQAKD